MSSSTFKPYAPGDLFVAATLLNNPNDDHAGQGRILQYGSDLKPKGELLLADTTHLVGGLTFDAAGVLWAFDSQEFVVLNIHRDGRVVRRREFGARPFSHVNFAADGTLLFGEHVVGDSIKPEIRARMHTDIPFMPGTQRFGDGHVFRYSSDGRLLKEYATATHGGMGGFLGVTMSAVSPDGRTLVYCSETGPRLMRYDLVEDRQLPDLQSFTPPYPPGPPPMFFGMAFASDGTLYVLRGASLHVVDEAGQTTRQIPLEGFGWATLQLCADGRHAFTSSFFSGEVAKIDLSTGAKVGSIATGAPKAVAGLAEFAG
jgi:sugar lactone lactonase YvrE